MSFPPSHSFIPCYLSVLLTASPVLPGSSQPRIQPLAHTLETPYSLSIQSRTTSIPIAHSPSVCPNIKNYLETNGFNAPTSTMPLMNGFMRRKGPASSAELRRHSFYSADSASNPAVPTIDSRASEQIPRRPSAADFLSPDSALDGSSTPGTIIEKGAESLHRTVSPPIQEESQKHRRFSMLKFRHASDSQLATRGMSKPI